MCIEHHDKDLTKVRQELVFSSVFSQATKEKLENVSLTFQSPDGFTMITLLAYLQYTGTLISDKTEPQFVCSVCIGVIKHSGSWVFEVMFVTMSF